MDPLNTPQPTPNPAQPVEPTPPVSPEPPMASQPPVESAPLNPQPPLEEVPPVVPVTPVPPVDPAAPAAATFPDMAPTQPVTPSAPVMDAPAPTPGFAPMAGAPTAPAPQAPVFSPAAPQTAPQFGGMVASSTPADPISSKKFFTRSKISAVSGGIVALVIVAGILTQLFTVTSADYRDAVDAVNDTVDAYNGMADTSLLSSLETGDTSSEVASLESNHTKFEDSYKKLGDLKAIKRDKEAHQAYTTLDGKKPKFETAYNAVVEAGKYIAPAIAPMNDANSNNLGSTLSTVRDNLAGLTLNEQVNKDYVAKLLPLLEQAVSAYKSGNSSQLMTIADQLTDADDGWTSAIDNLTDEGELKDDINALGQVVEKKQ